MPGAQLMGCSPEGYLDYFAARLVSSQPPTPEHKRASLALILGTVVCFGEPTSDTEALLLNLDLLRRTEQASADLKQSSTHIIPCLNQAEWRGYMRKLAGNNIYKTVDPLAWLSNLAMGKPQRLFRQRSRNTLDTPAFFICP